MAVLNFKLLSQSSYWSKLKESARLLLVAGLAPLTDAKGYGSPSDVRLMQFTGIASNKTLSDARKRLNEIKIVTVKRVWIINKNQTPRSKLIYQISQDILWNASQSAKITSSLQPQTDSQPVETTVSGKDCQDNKPPQPVVSEASVSEGSVAPLQGVYVSKKRTINEHVEELPPILNHVHTVILPRAKTPIHDKTSYARKIAETIATKLLANKERLLNPEDNSWKSRAFKARAELELEPQSNCPTHLDPSWSEADKLWFAVDHSYGWEFLEKEGII